MKDADKLIGLEVNILNCQSANQRIRVRHSVRLYVHSYDATSIPHSEGAAAMGLCCRAVARVGVGVGRKGKQYRMLAS